jgi:V-type H+-transporting ATPase subunit D
VGPLLHCHEREDELTWSREEFFRLKKVQGKKKRDAEQADKDRTAANAEHTAGGGELQGDEGIGGGDAGGGDMLDEGKDEDVIF